MKNNEKKFKQKSESVETKISKTDWEEILSLISKNKLNTLKVKEIDSIINEYNIFVPKSFNKMKKIQIITQHFKETFK